MGFYEILWGFYGDLWDFMGFLWWLHVVSWFLEDFPGVFMVLFHGCFLGNDVTRCGDFSWD